MEPSCEDLPAACSCWHLLPLAAYLPYKARVQGLCEPGPTSACCLYCCLYYHYKEVLPTKGDELWSNRALLRCRPSAAMCWSSQGI